MAGVPSLLATCSLCRGFWALACKVYKEPGLCWLHALVRNMHRALTCKACIDIGHARISLQLHASAAHQVINEDLHALDLHARQLRCAQQPAVASCMQTAQEQCWQPAAHVKDRRHEQADTAEMASLMYLNGCVGARPPHPHKLPLAVVQHHSLEVPGKDGGAPGLTTICWGLFCWKVGGPGLPLDTCSRTYGLKMTDAKGPLGWPPHCLLPKRCNLPSGSQVQGRPAHQQTSMRHIQCCHLDAEGAPASAEDRGQLKCSCFAHLAGPAGRPWVG